MKPPDLTWSPEEGTLVVMFEGAKPEEGNALLAELARICRARGAAVERRQPALSEALRGFAGALDDALKPNGG
jgi:hypothetical protein